MAGRARCGPRARGPARRRPRRVDPKPRDRAGPGRDRSNHGRRERPEAAGEAGGHPQRPGRTTPTARPPTTPMPTPSARPGSTWTACRRPRRRTDQGPADPVVASALAAALDDWAAVRRDLQRRPGSVQLAWPRRPAWPTPIRGATAFAAALDHPDKLGRLAALRALAKSASLETLGPISLTCSARR